MAEKIEKMEATENRVAPALYNETAESFMEISREMEEAGNHDMAQYYAEKAKAFSAEEKPAFGSAKLGGWYAGYTANEWRDKAKEEFVKNGDSLKYKQYCDNAMKAKS